MSTNFSLSTQLNNATPCATVDPWTSLLPELELLESQLPELLSPAVSELRRRCQEFVGSCRTFDACDELAPRSTVAFDRPWLEGMESALEDAIRDLEQHRDEFRDRLRQLVKTQRGLRSYASLDPIHSRQFISRYQ